MKTLPKIITRIAALAIAAVAAIVLATVAINAYCILGTRGQVHTIAQVQDDGMTADAILVLGASVLPDGSPSDILADRLEVAADLYLAGAAPVVIASGDNRSSHYNESDAMKRYLESLGVPSEAIRVDHAGYDTYGSVYRAVHAYGADSMFVVTQAYHLYRALMISDMLGTRSIGVASDKGAYDNQKHYSLREVVARDKDFFQALIKARPEDADQPIVA